MQLDGVPSYENVFIYVADALRFDYVPDRLSDRWPLVKTAASGVASPTCFSTMVTGRYPPQHGVWGFDHRLSAEIPTVFDMTDNPSFYRGGGQVGEVLGTESLPDHDVESAEPPFIAVERDLVTHAPYAEIFTWDDAEFDSHEAYWRARRGDRARIVDDYERGAELTADRFLARLDTLEDRGLLDDTLVVFTADHGELLGEHGLVGHGTITAPELVYVPTMFANDGVDVEGQFMAHVDLVPTIASVLDRDFQGGLALPGFDLTEGAPDERLVFNEMKRSYGHEWSTWDGDGGYVFSDDGAADKLRWFATRLVAAQEAIYSRRRFATVLSTAVDRWRNNPLQIGTPGFDVERASAFSREVLADTREAEARTIDEEGMERLRAMGYVEDLQ